jgi:hypothetical protein
MNYRRHGHSRSPEETENLATKLGLFSLILGAAEVMAPRTLGRALGMERQAGLLRAYSLREIAAGIGILVARHPIGWLWGRVAGDAIDIATLTPAVRASNPKRNNVGLALAAVAAVTLLDVYCAQQLANDKNRRRQQPFRDYSKRSGFPDLPEKMRGTARTP